MKLYMVTADRSPAVSNAVMTDAFENGLRILRTVIKTYEFISAGIKSVNIRIDSENSEMITPFTIFCLVIYFRASDFNLSDREITLEIGRIILSIPQTEFYITVEIK